VVPIVPNRGLILDRNGVVLATNYSAYTLEITPSRAAPLERPSTQLSKVVDIHPRDRAASSGCWRSRKSFESLPIRTADRRGGGALCRAALPLPRRGDQGAAVPQLPAGRTGSHVIGYIGRINQARRSHGGLVRRDDQANYRGTEYIGKLGVEQSYERSCTASPASSSGDLGRRPRRAPPGQPPGHARQHRRAVHRHQAAEAGGGAVGDRRGALVAIDPRNGEVLALVSASPPSTPTCSSTASTRRTGSALNESIDKPLLNRACAAPTRPARPTSPSWRWPRWTPASAPRQVINDPGYFNFGGHTFRSHGTGGLGAVDMHHGPDGLHQETVH
jgi:penicillin-binding protein 2